MARPGHDGSTGHGTGRTMPVPLGVVLARDRYQVKLKQYVRRTKRAGDRREREARAATAKPGILARAAKALGLA